MWFEALSGPRINLNKNDIFPVGLVGNVEELAMKLDCEVETHLTLYLGLPLAPSPPPIR